MEEVSKTGRKLRPRKVSTESRPAFSTAERKPYGEHKTFGPRPEGDRKPYGDRPARPYGERKSFGPRPEGDRKPYGDRPARLYGEHKPYGEHKTYGERKSFGPRPEGEARPYGDRPARPYGEHRTYGDRPARPAGKFGGRKPGRKPFVKREEAFGKSTEEGINRMIRRRPLVEDGASAPSRAVQEPVREEVRLNKFIANSGVCSRREADTLIQAGVVTVNGEVVTELGVKVNVFNDDIRFNGERLKGEEKVYIVMNKPRGYVTTASDPHAEKTVMELLKDCKYRVFPVGRLDKNTTGVLMFTNDGEMSERLTHPSYDKKKIYQVSLDKPLDNDAYEKILSGVTLSDGDVKADELEYIDAEDRRKLGIEIHSGKNRVVRRIFESLGYDVKALDRVYFAGLTKKGLKKGEWRQLTESEVNILRMGAYV